MSYNEQIPVVATEDLSAAQYHACDIDGTLAQVGDTAIGLLQNKPENGEDASLVYSGRSRFRAGGGSISIGARLTCAASGWVTAAGSGDAIVGRALSAVTSGSIGEGVFGFANNAEQS